MAKKNLKKGVFITFEGSEGSGKSTQAKLLSDFLRKNKLPVLFVREPGSTLVGEKIRNILLDPKNKKMTPVSEMLLYMAARAEFVEHIIKPALNKRKVVISDRFLDSTLAYQGFGLGIDTKTIKNVAKLVCRDIKPDVTILLDVTSSVGLRRAGRVRDRIERRKLSYHHRVRKGYLSLAKSYAKRIKFINVDKLSVEQAQYEIQKIISQRLCL